MHDHSSGYVRATSRFDAPLHHNSCGGKVELRYQWFDSAQYHCAGCNQVWVPRVFEKFSRTELSDRFHVRPPPTKGTMVLVEATEGRNTYTTTVTVAELWANPKKYKKVKLP